MSDSVLKMYIVDLALETWIFSFIKTFNVKGKITIWVSPFLFHFLFPFLFLLEIIYIFFCHFFLLFCRPLLSDLIFFPLFWKLMSSFWLSSSRTYYSRIIFTFTRVQNILRLARNTNKNIDLCIRFTPIHRSLHRHKKSEKNNNSLVNHKRRIKIFAKENILEISSLTQTLRHFSIFITIIWISVLASRDSQLDWLRHPQYKRGLGEEEGEEGNIPPHKRVVVTQK